MHQEQQHTKSSSRIAINGTDHKGELEFHTIVISSVCIHQLCSSRRSPNSFRYAKL